MAKTYPVYRCSISSQFTKEIPDCYGCHAQECQYNRGFSEKPCIIVKDITVDEKGKIISETGEKPLYPN